MFEIVFVDCKVLGIVWIFVEGFFVWKVMELCFGEIRFDFCYFCIKLFYVWFNWWCILWGEYYCVFILVWIVFVYWNFWLLVCFIWVFCFVWVFVFELKLFLFDFSFRSFLENFFWIFVWLCFVSWLIFDIVFYLELNVVFK